jgi:hypothetical protein
LALRELFALKRLNLGGYSASRERGKSPRRAVFSTHRYDSAAQDIDPCRLSRHRFRGRVLLPVGMEPVGSDTERTPAIIPRVMRALLLLFGIAGLFAA